MVSILYIEEMAPTNSRIGCICLDTNIESPSCLKADVVVLIGSYMLAVLEKSKTIGSKIP